MTQAVPRRAIRHNGAGVVLAALALIVRLVIPPGYMPSWSDPARLTICTDHGPLDEAPGPSFPDDNQHGKHADHPCVFGAHAPGLTPVASDAMAVFAPAWRESVAHLPTDLFPGRGLAAPPPPSQGPPTSTI